MELNRFFKSITEEDRCAVVICNADHEIIYMNPAARERYKRHGGGALVGKSIMACHNEKSREMIEKVVEHFKASKENNRVFIYYNEKENKDAYMVALRDDDGEMIGYYEKHEYRTRETEKPYNFD